MLRDAAFTMGCERVSVGVIVSDIFYTLSLTLTVCAGGGSSRRGGGRCVHGYSCPRSWMLWEH